MTDDRTAAGGDGVGGGGGGGSTGNMMNFARGAKGIALLGFLLPWVTVSCAGTPLIRMSGLDMATGNVTPVANPAAGLPGAPPGAANPMANIGQGFSADIFVILVALLIVGGLVATFVLPRRRGALVGMVTSAAAAALAAFEVLIRIRGAVTDSLRESASKGGAAGSPGEREMQQMAQMISVEPGLGFWITLLALIAAAVLFKMAHGRRDAVPGAAPFSP
ncbi:MAG TPA: hypothetical protein VF702_01410 [Allosphingosinicella sp.]|jgi:hypothetical protein